MNVHSTCAQAPSLKDFHSGLNLNDFLLAQLTSLKVAPSNSLNAKRPVISKTDDGSSSNHALTCKKLKANGDTLAIHLTKQDVSMQKTAVKYRQPEKKSCLSLPDAVVIDEEEDCLIIENPLVENSSTTCVFEENSSLEKYFDSLLDPLSQQLKLFTESPSSESLWVKEPEIVIIDYDDEDQLTCQSTPITKQDDLSNYAENLELQKQNSIKSDETLQENQKILAPVNAEQYTKIPSFDLSIIRQKQRKIRKVKCLWQPDCYESEAIENWTQEIERAVGIQITNQEKVLKAMRNFDMNLTTALEVIKRNKAQYKDYFRIKKVNKH